MGLMKKGMATYRKKAMNLPGLHQLKGAGGGGMLGKGMVKVRKKAMPVGRSSAGGRGGIATVPGRTFR